MRFHGQLNHPVPFNPSFYKPVELTIEYDGNSTQTTITAAGRTETADGGYIAGQDLYYPGNSNLLGVRFNLHHPAYFVPVGQLRH